MELTIVLFSEHYCEVSVRQCLTSRRSRQSHINLVPMDSAQIMLLEKIPKEYTMCVCLHIHTFVHAHTHTYAYLEIEKNNPQCTSTVDSNRKYSLRGKYYCQAYS